MDNLQSKGESEASENDYYISPLNDQTSVLVVGQLQMVYIFYKLSHLKLCIFKTTTQ